MAHSAEPISEPQTPLWLPALGIAVFVLVAIVWAITPSFARVDTAPAAAVHADAGTSDAPIDH